jgi:hypothetical protein
MPSRHIQIYRSNSKPTIDPPLSRRLFSFYIFSKKYKISSENKQTVTNPIYNVNITIILALSLNTLLVAEHEAVFLKEKYTLSC